MTDFPRNLRGKKLAKEIHNLNGHQNELKFIVFHPIWFACLVLAIVSFGFPFLSIFRYIAFIGLIVEISIWCMYFMKTRELNAYPGLLAWLDIQKRRLIMNSTRLASRLGYPTDH